MRKSPQKRVGKGRLLEGKLGKRLDKLFSISGSRSVGARGDTELVLLACDKLPWVGY